MKVIFPTTMGTWVKFNGGKPGFCVLFRMKRLCIEYYIKYSLYIYNIF